MQLIRKNVKRLTIKISGNGDILITAPIAMHELDIQHFVLSKKSWIEKHRARLSAYQVIPQDNPREIEQLKIKSKEYLTQRINELANQHRISFNRLFIRDQRTKWGTCSSMRNIGLNRKLIKLPKHLIDYVICHELAHLSHMNHSLRFWTRVGELYPERDEARKELRKYGGNIG